MTLHDFPNDFVAWLLQEQCHSFPILLSFGKRHGIRLTQGIFVNQIEVEGKKDFVFSGQKMVSTGHRSSRVISRGQKLSDKQGQKKTSMLVCYSPSCGGLSAQCYSPLCRRTAIPTNSSRIKAETSKPSIVGRSTIRRGKTKHSKVLTIVDGGKKETVQSSCYSSSCRGGQQCYSPTCLAGKKVKQNSTNMNGGRVEVSRRSNIGKSQEQII